MEGVGDLGVYTFNSSFRGNKKKYFAGVIRRTSLFWEGHEGNYPKIVKDLHFTEIPNRFSIKQDTSQKKERHPITRIIGTY